MQGIAELRLILQISHTACDSAMPRLKPQRFHWISLVATVMACMVYCATFGGVNMVNEACSSDFEHSYCLILHSRYAVTFPETNAPSRAEPHFSG
jgi:hypothetical protein